MKRRLAAIVLAGLGFTPWPAPAAGARIDPQLSHAEFSVQLLWLRTIHGRFTRLAGEFTTDANGRMTVDARIAVDSIVMDSARFRRWVLAPEFFDAARYPTIHFVSNPVAPALLDRGGTLEGRLTLRGITGPMHFELQPAPCLTLATEPCQIEALGRVRRSDFGMVGRRGMLSDEVRLGLLITLEHVPH